MKKIIAIVAGILLLFLGVFCFLQIREVKVEGGAIYSEKEIIEKAMSDQFAYHTVYYLFRTKLAGVPCLPFTQEIDVEWVSPVSIVLHVYDKTISGCLKYMGQYVYFDKDGIVLQSLSEPMEGIPVVTGIKFGKFTMNEAFDVEDDTLFDTIMNLSSLIHHYKLDVKEIDMQDKDVTIYSGKMQVHLGKKNFYDDDLAALASVLKKTSKKGISGTIEMEHFVPGNRIIVKTNDTVADTKSQDETEAGSEDSDPAEQTEDTETTESEDGTSTEEGETENDDESAQSETEESLDSEQNDDSEVQE